MHLVLQMRADRPPAGTSDFCLQRYGYMRCAAVGCGPPGARPFLTWSRCNHGPVMTEHVKLRASMSATPSALRRPAGWRLNSLYGSAAATPPGRGSEVQRSRFNVQSSMSSLDQGRALCHRDVALAQGSISCCLRACRGGILQSRSYSVITYTDVGIRAMHCMKRPYHDGSE